MKLWTPQRKAIDPQRRICPSCMRPTREWARANRHRMGSMLLAVCCCETLKYCAGEFGIPDVLFVTFSGVETCATPRGSWCSSTTGTINGTWECASGDCFPFAPDNTTHCYSGTSSDGTFVTQGVRTTSSPFTCHEDCGTMTCGVHVAVNVGCVDGLLVVTRLEVGYQDCFRTDETDCTYTDGRNHSWFEFRLNSVTQQDAGVNAITDIPSVVGTGGSAVPNDCDFGDSGGGGTATITWDDPDGLP